METKIILVVLRKDCISALLVNMFWEYSETNVMHILFSVLRIKSLYMFRALLLILRRRYT
jgi:hypothetical protein